MNYYRYDTHVHTSEVSPCGKVPAEGKKCVLLLRSFWTVWRDSTEIRGMIPGMTRHSPSAWNMTCIYPPVPMPISRKMSDGAEWA